MYEAQATEIAESVGRIKNAIEASGMGTTSTMVILGELLKAGDTLAFIKELPADQRDEFGAELWDQSIGTEPHALVNQVGFLKGEALEKVSDGMKAAALAYFNRGGGVPPA